MTWKFIVLALAGGLNQQQQDIVAYLTEENRVLREQLKGERLRFTDDHRHHEERPWFPGPACIAATSGRPLPARCHA